jgi:two-component system heavy metal sensor histidine kinase CusS
VPRARTARPRSLGARLAVWYAASAFGLVLLVTGFLYWAMARSMEEEEAEFVRDKLYTLGVVLRAGNVSEVTEQVVEEITTEWAGGPDAELFVRLRDDRDVLVAETRGMADLGLPPAAFPAPTPLADGLGRDVWHTTPAGRVLQLRSIQAPWGPDDARTCRIEIAVDRTDDVALLEGVRRRTAAILAMALLGSTLGGVAIARRGMRPVSRIGETLRQIRSTTLHERIATHGLPTELRDLAATSNEMLDHIERAFRQLSRLSADIAHELRTPIHNLRGEVEVALARPRTPEEYRNLLGSCLEECTRLSGLIDSLLFLARAEGRSQELRPQPLVLGEELAGIAEFYEPLAAEAGVALSLRVGENARAELDRALLQSAVGNLIENAIAATKPEGSVTVTSGEENSGVYVEVADSGRGIAPEHLPHLFDPLYRVDAARGGGTGLGLSIVKSIAELHGGSVSLASETGVGTRVRLWFPAPAVRDPARPVPGSPRSG